jgi:hypothetical protein
MVRRRALFAAKGSTWNESELYRDPWTLRRVRRLTTDGCYNSTPTYHTRTAWTADGEYLIFSTGRYGQSAVMRCHVPTGDLTQLTGAVDGMAIGGSSGIGAGICVAPTKGWVIYNAQGALRAVHVETLEECTLIPELEGGGPTVDADEAYCIVAANNQTLGDYWDDPDGARFRMLRVPLEGGEVETLYVEDGVRGGHLQYSPTDPDLVLLDRDTPRWRYPQRGVSNRIWTYRLSTGELTEHAPIDGNHLQMHSTWAWDGQQVIYHGPSAEGGWYIGLSDLAGNVVWEHRSETWKVYGHVSAMAGRPAIILDGNLCKDLLTWMYYDAELPRVEVIARHGTDWNGHEGQYPHPHPQSDPTGRYISYNVGGRGRSDVYVVEA